MLYNAIATISLGRSSAGHGLITKIQRAASAGFSGVEIFFECLELYAREIEGGKTAASRKALLEAAQRVHEVCGELRITVVCLQPFLYFEGLIDEHERKEKLDLLQFWFELCRVLDTDLIQIPTNFRPQGTTGDLERVVMDLRTAAELGLQQSPPIRFAYEALSWGNYFDTWDQTWAIAKQVNLPNFGLRLDVFHIAGRVWADPSTPSGLTENCEEDLKRSLERLVREVDPEKIFYVQIGDAERLDKPIVPGHPLFEEGIKPRMSWSRNARLYAFETDLGGYLPLEQVCRAIFVKLDWEGWVSMEMFHKSLYQTDTEMVGKLATRAMISWSKFLAFLENASEKPQSA
jgi:4-hydroxyphenylpyruvate dioxygenase